MPLPQPQVGSTFPVPTGPSFPTPTGPSDPMFGVNPFSPGTNMVLGPTSFIDPTLGLPDLAARRQQLASQIQMAQLAQMGLAPQTDPHTWTPQEAANQTDQAIAKIATVNPDAAQRLMDMRAPDPSQESGQSFWDSLKHVAGDLLSPALNIGGKVLDIIGRTAYIVPNVAFDLVDGKKNDVWGDVAGALTGNVRHNWNSVFQEMGWDGGGLGGFLRATIGFAGDIATDPLTWIIPAGAGVKSAEAAGTAAEVAATRTASLTAEADRLFGSHGGDLLLSRYRTLLGKAEEAGVKLGEGDTAERLSGLIGEMAHGEEADLLRKQFELADKVYRAQRTRSLQTFFKGSKGFYDESGNLIASTDEVKAGLNKVIQEGAGAKHGSTEWSQARQLASTLGGSRFKVAVPFTNLRYISPAVPGSKFLSEKTIGVVSRMAAGQSGMNRMVQYIAAHPEEGWAPLRDWMEQGFDKALEQHPDMVNELRGKFRNMGSMFYSASEQVGRITAHFDSTAAATRTGLAGAVAEQAKTRIQNQVNQFIRETAYNVVDKNGNRVDRQQFVRQLESTLGISFRKRHNTASFSDLERFADYLDLFPTSVDTSNPAAIKAWWDSLPQHSVGPLTAEEAALREDTLRRAQQVAAELTPAQREVLDQVNAVWDHMRNEVAKRDASLGDVKMQYGQVGKLNPAQAAEAAAGSKVPETVWYQPQTAADGLRVSQVGITGDSSTAIGDFVGIHGTVGEHSPGVGYVPMRVKLANPLYIDESQAGALLDQYTIDAANEADRVAAESRQAIDTATEMPIGTQVSERQAARDRAQMVTDKLRKEHPENDGIVIKQADGTVHVVAFDPQNVWAVDEGAANIVGEQGFFHRTLTSDAKEWLRGKIPTEGNKLLIAEPELEAFLRRQTIGMNRRQAEQWMRDWLTRTYGAKGMPDHIWENDLLKVHEHYVEGLGKAIASEELGKQARRFVQLGDLAPALFGKAPRDQQYEWNLSASVLSALRNKDTKLTRAIMASHEADFRRMEAQHEQIAKTAEQYGLFAAMVEESLGYGIPVPDRLVQAARKYGATVHEAQTKVEKNLAGLEKAAQKHVDDLQAYERAVAEIPETDPIATPKSADLLVSEPDANGEVTIRGWHGHIDPGAPKGGRTGLEKAAAVEDPSQLGSGGFHIGTWDQAKHIVDLEVQNSSSIRSIGSRDGHDWPQAITVRWTDANGQEQTWTNFTEHSAYDLGEPGLDTSQHFDAWTEVRNEDVRRRPNQSIEEAARETAGAPADAAVEMRGVQPDLYYEDVIQPVEAKGQFIGHDIPLQEGPLDFKIPPNESPTMGAVFTGSGRDTPLAAQERGYWQGTGAHGLIYQNAVEGQGRSAVVFDPRDGKYVWASNAPQRFEDQVAAGKVFITKDGKAVTQRVAGSHRLRPREDILSNLAKIREEQRQLNDLATRLRHGGAALESRPIPGDVTEAAGSLGKTIAARAKRESEAQLAAGKRLEKLRRKTATALGEANKAYSEFHGVVAQAKPTLVKVETAGDLGGLTRLHVPGLEGFAMPAYIAEEFHQLVDTHGIGHLRESWRKYVMGPWKRWATYRWPGFHVRNFFGAFFNNWLGGVVEKDYVFSWRVNHARDGQLKWADRVVSDWERQQYHLDRVFGHAPTYAEVADRIGSEGIGRANTMAVMGIGPATEATQAVYEAVGKNNRNAARNAVRRADDVMKSMGSSVEDFHRVAAWGRGMAATNGDTYGARAFVMMRHGDYADLTGAEDFVRDLVPFYKWQRTNIPYQIRMLAENPAKLSLVHDKIPGLAYDLQGIDRQAAELQQPDWMKESTAIPIPSWMPVIGSKGPDALKFAMFDLPYSDLYNGLNDYMSSALPVVRNVLESYGFKQTLFSGKSLQGKYVPLSGVFNLPGVRDILTTAKLAQKGGDGQLYMEDKLQNVLMGWPIFSRFRNFTESDPARVDQRLGGLFSMMAGVGIREGDYTQTELDFYYNEVRPLLDQYKSLGINLPTTDQLQSGQVGAQVGLFSGGAFSNQPSPFLNGTAA